MAMVGSPLCGNIFGNWIHYCLDPRVLASADAVILAFSMARRRSYRRALAMYKQLVEKNCEDIIEQGRVVLVGMMSDEGHCETAIPRGRVQFHYRKNMHFFEVSSVGVTGLRAHLIPSGFGQNWFPSVEAYAGHRTYDSWVSV